MFYARSREYWAQMAHQSSDNRGKMLRRDGFTLAQERYSESHISINHAGIANKSVYSVLQADTRGSGEDPGRGGVG